MNLFVEPLKSRARALIALGALLVALLGSEGRRPAAASLPLNFILIVTDDQSLGSEQAMPYLNGRSDWVRFENAFVHFAKCCPSRATILTGLYSHNNGVENNRSGAEFGERPNLATWLHEAGYQTALFGKYLNDYPFGFDPSHVPAGWDQWYALASSRRYYNYVLYENGNAVTYGSKPSDYVTDVLARKATSFVRTSAGGPFFLYFAPNAPHDPHVPADRHLNDFHNAEFSPPPNFNEEDVSDKPLWVQVLQARSKRAMAETERREREQLLAVDDAVAQLFAVLESEDLLDRTVVIYSSDNGFAYGEHRWLGKKCGFEECLGVPFYVRAPGVPGGLRQQLVSNTDFTPTIIELAGLPAQQTDGLSLVPILMGSDGPWRDTILIRSLGQANGVRLDFWGVRTDRYKYMELGTGEKELYDLEADPYELDNLIKDPAYDQLEAELARRLAEMRP